MEWQKAVQKTGVAYRVTNTNALRLVNSAGELFGIESPEDCLLERTRYQHRSLVQEDWEPFRPPMNGRCLGRFDKTAQMGWMTEVGVPIPESSPAKKGTLGEMLRQARTNMDLIAVLVREIGETPDWTNPSLKGQIDNIIKAATNIRDVL